MFLISGRSGSRGKAHLEALLTVLFHIITMGKYEVKSMLMEEISCSTCYMRLTSCRNELQDPRSQFFTTTIGMKKIAFDSKQFQKTKEEIIKRVEKVYK